MDTIAKTYSSILALFYQKIPQNQYTNSYLANYAIDYSLLLPASQLLTELNSPQVSAQIQEYIDLCNETINIINTNFSNNITYLSYINILESSIANLNSFAESLLAVEKLNTFTYTLPFDMGLSQAMALNNLGLDNTLNVIKLNPQITDFTNITVGTVITLTR